MTKRQDRNTLYLKRQFDGEIILLCVRWYITYRLSYRDLVGMMAERGVVLSHTTIMRWVTRYEKWSQEIGQCDKWSFCSNERREPHR